MPPRSEPTSSDWIWVIVRLGFTPVYVDCHEDGSQDTRKQNAWNTKRGHQMLRTYRKC